MQGVVLAVGVGVLYLGEAFPGDFLLIGIPLSNTSKSSGKEMGSVVKLGWKSEAWFFLESVPVPPGSVPFSPCLLLPSAVAW